MSLISYILRRRFKKNEPVRPGFIEAMSIADIAFLLLIFFIVTGSFILRQGVFFSLPSATASSVRVENRDLVEVFPLNENYLFQGGVVSREALFNSLENIRLDNSDIIMVIVMAPEVRYERLVDALSLARETGIIRVSLRDGEGGQSL